MGIMTWLNRIQQLKRGKAAKESLRIHLEDAENVGRFGSWEMDLVSKRVAWSNGLYRLLELSPNEVQPSIEIFSAMMDAVGIETLHSAIRNCIEKQTPGFQAEYHLNLNSGKKIYVRSEGALKTTSSGQVLVGVTRDITDLRAAREIALAADQERAMAEGITAAIITCRHEINNPLACAIGTLELIDKTDAIREQIEDAEKSLWRIADILQRMSELSAEKDYKFQSYANSELNMLDLGEVKKTIRSER